MLQVFLVQGVLLVWLDCYGWQCKGGLLLVLIHYCIWRYRHCDRVLREQVLIGRQVFCLWYLCIWVNATLLGKGRPGVSSLVIHRLLVRCRLGSLSSVDSLFLQLWWCVCSNLVWTGGYQDPIEMYAVLLGAFWPSLCYLWRLWCR